MREFVQCMLVDQTKDVTAEEEEKSLIRSHRSPDTETESRDREPVRLITVPAAETKSGAVEYRRSRYSDRALETTRKTEEQL